MTTVCPKCGRAFEAPTGARLTCPGSGCGYAWEPASDFQPTLVSQDERKFVHLARVTFAGGKTEEVSLTSTLTVGRAAENNLVVNDLKLSRRHLQLERRGESYWVKDLGSSSGTLLNGQRVVEQRLTNGDRILVGDTTIEYLLRVLDTGDTARKVRVSVGGDGGAAAAAMPRVPLNKDRIVFGRGTECDVVLPSPNISRKHAALSREGAGFVLEDLGSANGIAVNGQLVKRHALQKGDRIRVGPYVLTFDGVELAQEDQQGRITLEAVAVGKKAGSVEILRDVSVVIRPNEFVGLLGPSGAGKSTFMDTLNGFRPATSGKVLVNGEDLYAIFGSFKTNIGYVPQDDIIHRELTVRDALYYTAKMRLPEDTSETEVHRIIDEVIQTLELQERADTRISALSGGQRKRVSIGVELITKPPLLFLDEPTSGLDPGTEEKMMNLFRKLANGGRTLVLTTHVMENVEQLDLIVVLVKGRLAYYGPPLDALKYFAIPKVTKIYDCLEKKKPEEWADLYLKSPYHQKYVVERQATAHAPAVAPSPMPRKAAPMPHAQFITLILRYVAILLGDRKNIITFLLPGPLIGFLITLAFNAETEAGHRQFLVFMTVSAVFFGTFNSFREIVKEKPIYRRERMVNLQILPYVLSKLFVLSAIFVIEVFMMITVVYIFEHHIRGSFIVHYMLLLSASIAACGLGLIISSAMNSSEKAIGVLIMVIIPEIIFCGGLRADPLTGFPNFLAHFMVTFFCYDGMQLNAGEGGGGIIGDLFILGIYCVLYLATTAGVLKLQDVK